METKKCCRCQKEKVSADFKEGRKTCLICLEKVSQYQKNNPEKRNDICKRHNEKKKDEILEQKKEKVWCDCCRMEVRRQGWQDHLNSMRHRHYLKVEAGEVEEEQNKRWCETCRVYVDKKTFSKHKNSKRHLAMKEINK